MSSGIDYFKVYASFRSQTYQYVVENYSGKKITGKEIQIVLEEEFETQIPPAEISYNATQISKHQYESSKFPKKTRIAAP